VVVPIEQINDESVLFGESFGRHGDKD
jgi:hypothetical protein